MAFGEVEAGGLAALIAIAVLLALIARTLVRSRRWARETAGKRAAIRDLDDRFRVGSLRHKDFEQWFEADQKRRVRVGLAPLDPEEARARRFDPAYELDVPAPRIGHLRRRQKEIGEAARRGEEPPPDRPPG